MYANDEDWFLTQAEVEERPFTSHTPLVGPLIARFRAAWNRISTQWYVRPLLAQQNRYNRLLAERLHDVDARLVAQDRALTQLTHDLAETSAQLAQARQELAALRAERVDRGADSAEGGAA